MKFEVIKKYHFYAGHRNQYIIGSKCVNPHGHTYKVAFSFLFPYEAISGEDGDKSGVTVPFEVFDKTIEPLMKMLDHSFIIDENDHELLPKFQELNFKLTILPGAASVENLCFYISELIKTTAPELYPFLTKISIRETESSEVTLIL